MLSNTDKVQPSYTYIDSATPNNISRFANDPTMIELKNDIMTFAQRICDTLTDEEDGIDGVRRAYIDDKSPYSGLSTYIYVAFDKPNDSEYLKKYKGDYLIEIRLSDHYDSAHGISDFDIDMVGKTVEEFEQDVIDLVRQHKKLLDNAYADWQETHRVSDAQKYRNRVRIIKNQKAQNKRS